MELKQTQMVREVQEDAKRKLAQEARAVAAESLVHFCFHEEKKTQAPTTSDFAIVTFYFGMMMSPILFLQAWVYFTLVGFLYLLFIWGGYLSWKEARETKSPKDAITSWEKLRDHVQKSLTDPRIRIACVEIIDEAKTIQASMQKVEPVMIEQIEQKANYLSQLEKYLKEVMQYGILYEYKTPHFPKVQESGFRKACEQFWNLSENEPQLFGEKQKSV